MDVVEVIDRWMAGELSTKEVMMATGLRSVQALYAEVRFDMHDRENEREHEDMNALLAEEDQQLYEQAAYEVFGHYLQENPEGLSQCVKALRRENYLGRKVRMSAR
ncbi:hypothetical protein [Neorhizobium galegae]|uniref:Uncharacterized protein n=1 Tax=Neorhizobium galegae bv. orientalis str. HAMBI 540 TaxID=1028800 RepID=A0A068SKT7_NEOGA|nr:hypothetical protein [Neorhizobium galegae]MCQ1856163.1 hypothetical protein [Neorhizobium galegae]CDN46812.1 Hypothetical protein RG540_CH06220 [Neorhizobium galegae bv. orientalis str. HAMBI 540]